MRGGAPPDLQVATVAGTTDPAPNTNTTTQIIAAPGATRRIRLWAYELCIGNSAYGVALTKGLVRSNPGIATRIDLGISEDSPVAYIALPGGIACATGSGVEAIDQSSAASRSIIHRVWYTVEEAP